MGTVRQRGARRAPRCEHLLRRGRQALRGQQGCSSRSSEVFRRDTFVVFVGRHQAPRPNGHDTDVPAVVSTSNLYQIDKNKDSRHHPYQSIKHIWFCCITLTTREGSICGSSLWDLAAHAVPVAWLPSSCGTGTACTSLSPHLQPSPQNTT